MDDDAEGPGVPHGTIRIGEQEEGRAGEGLVGGAVENVEKVDMALSKTDHININNNNSNTHTIPAAKLSARTRFLSPTPLLPSVTLSTPVATKSIPAKRKGGPVDWDGEVAREQEGQGAASTTTTGMNANGNGNGNGKTKPTNDNSTIRCICNSTLDDGFSIACDVCERWCHAACFDIVVGEVPEEWKCWECAPRPVDREKAAKIQRERRGTLSTARRVSPTTPVVPGPAEAAKEKKSEKKINYLFVSINIFR